MLRQLGRIGGAVLMLVGSVFLVGTFVVTHWGFQLGLKMLEFGDSSGLEIFGSALVFLSFVALAELGVIALGLVAFMSAEPAKPPATTEKAYDADGGRS